ncbi:MAG: metal-sulfur cluster assembly factor [Candidatus Thermoplasmatota archaeon]|nr:metal-sulfur cluster assembly factor [Candidatus Thermoplasmatota archaeon]MED5303519.1 metal-sulfur cluster assembly factor [Candidatus Thermoplasmatota archaeon]|tara:strand:- start:1156 stop:1458 length:303 start_codon:yes stop_codon:yes gene_type:complete
MSNNEGVMDALSEVIDPEMGISVTDLGLIYGVENQEGHLEVTMTLTSPGCPVAPEIMAAVHRAALSVDEVESVHVNLTFSPLWDPRVHATEDAQMELGVF